MEILSENKSKELLEKTNLIAHSEGFKNFCEKQYNAQRFIVGLSESGELKAIIPVFKRDLSGSVIAEVPIPIYYTEPLFLDSSYQLRPKILAEGLLEFMSADAVGINFYEIYRPGIVKFDGFKKKFVAHILDIGAEKDSERLLMEVIGKKARNQIRAGQKGMLTIDWPNPDSFYELYRKHRERLEVGIRPRSYFDNLSQSFHDELHILGVRHEGKLIGANLFVTNKDYLWLINNIFDLKYAHFYPNNFVYWEMIKWGISHGIRYFDYGGSGLSDAGLIHFKEGLGGQPHPLYAATFYKNFGSRLRYWMEQKTRHIKLKFAR